MSKLKMEVDSGEDENVEVNCIVCNDKCSISESYQDKANETRSRIPLAYSLFCKLVLNYNVTSGIPDRGGGQDLLWKFVEKYASVSLSSCGGGHEDEDKMNSGVVLACGECGEALEEILRLERFIEDLKVSQMNHVNTLKRSVLRLTPSIWNKYGSCEVTADDDANYWKQIQRQLISCLNDHTESTKPMTKKRKTLRRATEKPLEKNRKRQDPNPSARISQNDIKVPPPTLSPCSVRLTRLSMRKISKTTPNTPTSLPSSSSPSPSPTSALPRRPTRQSKLKAYDLLQKSMTESLPDEEEGGENVTFEQEQCGNNEEDADYDGFHGLEYFEDDDDFGDLDFCPSPAKIKKEPEDSDSADEEIFPEDEIDLDWNPTTNVENPKKKIKLDPKPEIRTHNRSSAPATTSALAPAYGEIWRFSRLQFFSPDIYLFSSTIIKYCSEEHLFICHEPGCSTEINGTFLDGSIQDNIRLHVREAHPRSSGKPDGRTRSCPLCSKEFSGPPKQFRNHMMKVHYTCRNAIKLICDTCGKDSKLRDDVTHKWSHRNFQEKVGAIQAGETYPEKLRAALKRQKGKDPLYTVVFGEGEVEVTPKAPSKKKMIPCGKMKRTKTSVSTIFYRLDKNIYLHKYTCFRYSEDKQIFSCLEENCSFEIPEWEPGVVGRIKNHVDQEHSSLAIRGIRNCLLCPFYTDGIYSFRAHLLQSHPVAEKVANKNKALAICEFCMRPVGTSDYLRHIWIHKSDEDALISIQAGDAISTDWMHALKERKIEPHYSLIFSASGQEKVESKKVKKKKAENSVKKEEKPVKIKKAASSQNVRLVNKTNNLLYMATDTILLYKCTLITVADNQSTLICNEPGCEKSFYGSPMGYYEVLDEVKRHVEECHEIYYHNYFQDPSSGHWCPVCGDFVNGPLELRYHFFKEHNRLSDRDGERTCTRTVCQSCWKQVHSGSYTTHVKTHMNDEEKKDPPPKKQAVQEIAPPIKVEPEDIITPSSSGPATGLLPGKSKPKKKISVSCKTCGKIFSSMKRLKCHLPIHQSMEERQKWMCHQCGKEMLSAQSVRSHIERVHHPELKKMRECPEPGCGKMFYRRDFNKFKIHMRKHRGEMPFVCELCGSGFYCSDQFRQHRQRVHGQKR